MTAPDEAASDEAAPLKVYYNSACPVCNAGISSQRDKMASCRVDWLDVHEHNGAADGVGGDLEFVRERLHVVDETGDVRVGLEAFIAIWRSSLGERWKARLFSLPLIRPLANWAYNVFARRLYRWNRRKGHW